MNDDFDAIDVDVAISAARQAVAWDQDVDPAVVAALLFEIDRLRGEQ